MTNSTAYSTEEINKFNALAAHWWDLNGPLKPLHGLNPLRLQFIQDRFDLAGKHVLDVGCGGGILTESLAKSGAIAVGLDLAADVLGVARTHAKEMHLDIDYQCIAVEDFANQHAGRFDVITCMELLEHVPDPASVIKACARLLKPQGRLFLSTLNRNLKSFLLGIIGAEYILNLVPKGTHSYAQFITPAELARMLREASFEVEKIRGLHYNPINRSFTLNQNCDVNYLLCAQLNQ